MRRLLLVFTCLLFLVSFVSSYDLEFYHSDHLGSPVLVTKEDQSVVWSSDYDIFGEAVNEEGVGDLKYNQKEEDATGLHYYSARYYNAELGRFITADTVKGKMTDLQSQNLYVYVQNNPMKYIDPTGNKLKGFDLSTSEIAGWMNSLCGGDFFSYNEETNYFEMTGSSFYKESASSAQLELYTVFENIVSREDEVLTLSLSTMPSFQGVAWLDEGIINLGRGSYEDITGSGGSLITSTEEIVFAHEMGHVYAKYRSKTIGTDNFYGRATETDAISLENSARSVMGLNPREYYATLQIEGGEKIGLYTPSSFDKYAKEYRNNIVSEKSGVAHSNLRDFILSKEPDLKIPGDKWLPELKIK